MTFRIVAGLSVSSNRFEIAREDTGSPVSMYIRTRSARTCRLRLSWIAAFFIVSTLCLTVLTTILGTLSSPVNAPGQKAHQAPTKDAWHEPRAAIWSAAALLLLFFRLRAVLVAILQMLPNYCRSARAAACRNNRCRAFSTRCRNLSRQSQLRDGHCQFALFHRRANAFPHQSSARSHKQFP